MANCVRSDVKNVRRIETSDFAKKIDLARLKSEVDKLEVDKLKPVPIDLSKLCDEVNKVVLLKILYMMN